MKMWTCLAVILAVGLLVGAFAADSYATCQKTVKVVMVSTYGVGPHVVYGVDLYQVLPGYYYYWYINETDEKMLNAAQAAETSGRIASIRGDIPTCPTDGAARYLGHVEWIHIIK